MGKSISFWKKVGWTLTVFLPVELGAIGFLGYKFYVNTKEINTNLNKPVENINKLNALVNTQLNKVEKQLEQIDDLLKQDKNSSEEVKSKFNNIKSDFKVIYQELSKTNNLLDKIKKLKLSEERLTKELTEAKNNAETIKKNLQEKKEELAKAKENLSKVRKTQEGLSSLDEKKLKSELIKVKNSAETIQKNLKEELSKVKDNLTNVTKVKTQLELELTTAENNAKTIQGKLVTTKKELASAQKNFNDKKIELKDTQERLSDLETAIKNLEESNWNVFAKKILDITKSLKDQTSKKSLFFLVKSLKNFGRDDTVSSEALGIDLPVNPGLYIVLKIKNKTLVTPKPITNPENEFLFPSKSLIVDLEAKIRSYKFDKFDKYEHTQEFAVTSKKVDFKTAIAKIDAWNAKNTEKEEINVLLDTQEVQKAKKERNDIREKDKGRQKALNLPSRYYEGLLGQAWEKYRSQAKKYILKFEELGIDSSALNFSKDFSVSYSWSNTGNLYSEFRYNPPQFFIVNVELEKEGIKLNKELKIKMNSSDNYLSKEKELFFKTDNKFKTFKSSAKYSYFERLSEIIGDKHKQWNLSPKFLGLNYSKFQLQIPKSPQSLGLNFKEIDFQRKTDVFFYLKGPNKIFVEEENLKKIKIEIEFVYRGIWIEASDILLLPIYQPKTAKISS